MPTKTASTLVLITFFLIGLIQGIGFTTIAAAGNFISSASGFSFNPEQYGMLFLPMVVGAIFASFYGGSLARKIGIRSVFIAGQICNILSMVLFALTKLTVHHSTDFSFSLFLVLMFFLGTGFGAALTALNSFAFFFFPAQPKRAVTALHSCLGIGTAIGPMLFILFLKQGLWWLDGMFIAVLYSALLCIAWITFPNPQQLSDQKKSNTSKLPFASRELWGFIAIAFLYGICETTFGNWGTIFLHVGKHLSILSAALSLSLFWGALTLGRILTVLLSFTLPARYIYCSLPLILLFSLFILYPSNTETILLSSFALAGLGCSAMLPLTVGFAQQYFTEVAPAISGIIIGVYMLGYGFASQGIGLIYKLFHLAYSTLFASLSIPIIALLILCLLVTYHYRSQVNTNHRK